MIFLSLFNLNGNKTTDLGNVIGNDGIYVGYTGMGFTHEPTNIHIKVIGYDENYVFLEMENAVWNTMYVKRGQSCTVLNLSFNGYSRGLKVYFDYITNEGLKIHLETVYPQAV